MAWCGVIRDFQRKRNREKKEEGASGHSSRNPGEGGDGAGEPSPAGLAEFEAEEVKREEASTEVIWSQVLERNIHVDIASDQREPAESRCG